MKPLEFLREIIFVPAFDRQPKDAIHCVTLRFMVKRNNRTVQFVLFTGWHLPHVIKHRSTEDRELLSRPVPTDLGYHSPEPMYDGHTPMWNDCPIIGGKCFYDGSTLNAYPVFDLLVREGGEAVWKYLEEYWVTLFGNPSRPLQTPTAHDAPGSTIAARVDPRDTPTAGKDA